MRTTKMLEVGGACADAAVGTSTVALGADPMSKILLIATAMGMSFALSACTVNPQEFEAFCGKNLKVRIEDPTAWADYKRRVSARNAQLKLPLGLDTVDPYVSHGTRVEDATEFLAIPGKIRYTIVVDSREPTPGRAVVVIDDFDNFVSDSLAGIPSLCSSRFPELWLNVRPETRRGALHE